MRLPAYRSAYLGRYHPYPRGGPRPSRDTDLNINVTKITTALVTPFTDLFLIHRTHRCMSLMMGLVLIGTWYTDLSILVSVLKAKA